MARNKLLICPQCKHVLTTLNVPRTIFFLALTGEVSYTPIKNQYNCPFCDYGIAGNEDLAIDRLKTGRWGYTTKEFEKLCKKGIKNGKV